MEANKSPEFIKCAMDAIEQGMSAKLVKEECGCSVKSVPQNFNKNSFTN